MFDFLMSRHFTLRKAHFKFSKSTSLSRSSCSDGFYCQVPRNKERLLDKDAKAVRDPHPHPMQTHSSSEHLKTLSYLYIISSLDPLKPQLLRRHCLITTMSNVAAGTPGGLNPWSRCLWLSVWICTGPIGKTITSYIVSFLLNPDDTICSVRWAVPLCAPVSTLSFVSPL